MTVYEYSPFFNENRVLEIKLREAAKWVDEVHISEADRTFSFEGKPKNCGFSPSENTPTSSFDQRLRYHSLNSEGLFRFPPRDQIYYDPTEHTSEMFDSWYWRLMCGNAAYHNEAQQRNHATTVLGDLVEDDDVVILSDVDEIIDSRFAEQVLEETRRHEIITVKLHYSVFYLNLFTRSNHGVPDFSYRLFVMTGKYFRTMPFTPDYLRKRGIEGGFLREIHCLEKPMGFHHSWLDAEKNALPKLQAFRANVRDQSIVSKDYAAKCLKARRLHYLDTDLYIDDEKTFLRSLGEIDTSGLWLRETSEG